MAKVKLFDAKGKEKGTIDLPKNFSSRIREDVVAKVVEAQKGMFMQPYGAKEGAGRGYSASGISKKRRHAWKGTYGKGISRIPRKIMSRSGSSFNWVGATSPNTRGGAAAHAPSSRKNLYRKINKNELIIAFNSGFSASIDAKALEKKYGQKTETAAVFNDAILATKTKEFLAAINSVFGETAKRAFKIKTTRAGKGKMRGRRYKSNAGMVFVIASTESMKRSGIDVIKVNELSVKDLSPNGQPGRIACYTEKAVKEIQEKFA